MEEFQGQYRCRSLENICADRYFASAFRNVSSLQDIPSPISHPLLESALIANERIEILAALLQRWPYSLFRALSLKGVEWIDKPHHRIKRLLHTITYLLEREESSGFPSEYDLRGIPLELSTVKLFYKKIFLSKRKVRLIVDLEGLSSQLNYLANNIIGHSGLIIHGIMITPCSKPAKFSEVEEILYRLDANELRSLKINHILYRQEDFFERKLCPRLLAFSQLTHLCLQQNRIVLKKNPSLETALSLALRNLPSLKALNVSSNNLNARLKSLLGKMPFGLERLEVRECSLSPEDLIFLTNSNHTHALTYLDIASNAYQPHLYENLLTNLTRVQTVHLQPIFQPSFHGQSEAFASICRVLINLPFLAKVILFVNGDRFSDLEVANSDLKSLRDILVQSPSIRRMILGYSHNVEEEFTPNLNGYTVHISYRTF